MTASPEPPPIPSPSPSTERTPQRFTLGFLIIASIAALYVCYVMARPFMEPVAFAAVMAIVFHPLHDRIRRRVRGPNLAALLATLAVLLIVISPLVGLGRAMSGEISGAYRFLSEKTAAGGGWIPYMNSESQKLVAIVGRHVDLSRLDVRTEVSSRLERMSAAIVGSVAGVVSNLGTFLFDAAISFFTLFFLFREGRRIRGATAAMLPLDRSRVNQLFTLISDTIVANVYGVLAVAATQGVLLAIGFAVLGLSSPVLWGVVTAVCSLVPLVGTGLVWVPASLVLLVSGHWLKAIILLGWGAGFVSVVDHVVRPLVIGERVKMNTLFVFFALLGGIEAFGIIGVFLGPLVLSVTFALLQMLRDETRAWQSGAAAHPNLPAGP
jgi:predicted PurR-regulated permease PerM